MLVKRKLACEETSAAIHGYRRKVHIKLQRTMQEIKKRRSSRGSLQDMASTSCSAHAVVQVSTRRSRVVSPADDMGSASASDAATSVMTGAPVGLGGGEENTE